MSEKATMLIYMKALHVLKKKGRQFSNGAGGRKRKIIVRLTVKEENSHQAEKKVSCCERKRRKAGRAEGLGLEKMVCNEAVREEGKWHGKLNLVHCGRQRK